MLGEEVHIGMHPYNSAIRSWPDLTQYLIVLHCCDLDAFVWSQASVLSALYMGAVPWFGTQSHHDREGFMCPRLWVRRRCFRHRGHVLPNGGMLVVDDVLQAYVRIACGCDDGGRKLGGRNILGGERWPSSFGSWRCFLVWWWWCYHITVVWETNRAFFDRSTARYYTAYITRTGMPVLSHPAPDFCFARVVCAPSFFEMILLTGSRFAAGLIYPGLVISTFSKCYATRSFLHHSWFGAVIDLEPSHDIHTCEWNATVYCRTIVHNLSTVFGQTLLLGFCLAACARRLLLQYFNHRMSLFKKTITFRHIQLIVTRLKLPLALDLVTNHVRLVGDSVQL